MERPLFVARDPRVFVVPEAAPADQSRVFVVDGQRWYERLRDERGDGYFVHVADSDVEFHARLEAEREPSPTELTADDVLAALVLEEFSQEGLLYPEVPVVPLQE